MRSFALAIAALLLLTACTDDPEPIEPTATPSAKATAPALPSEATKETPDGAIAFVKHWIGVFNFAVNEGAANEFEALNDPDCKGCKSYEDEIARLNRDDAEVRHFQWTGRKSHLTDDRRLEVAIESRAYEVRDSQTDDWSNVKGAHYLLGFDLRWSDGRWVVYQLYVPEEAG